MSLHIFLPFQLSHAPIFLLWKHALLPFSSTVTGQLDKLLSDHNHTAHFYHFAAFCPKRDQHWRQHHAFSSCWIGPPGKDALLYCLLESIQDPNLPNPAPNPKAAAYSAWAADFAPNGNSPVWLTCLPIEGPSFLPPFL